MSTIEIPSLLIESITKGKCVLFLGAGASYEAGLPTSTDLSKNLAEESDYPETFPHDLIDISQYYESKFGRAQLLSSLKEILQKPVKPSETHKIIANLGSYFNTIITTNYDKLLETAFEEVRNPLYVVSKETDLSSIPLNSNISTLIKIHGDLDSNNIILTRDDYNSYIDKSFKSAIGATLKSHLAIGTFLFVGYSLRDYNFVSLYESVRKELEDYMPRGFAVMPSPDPIESRIWSKRGIEIISATGKSIFNEINKSIFKIIPNQVFISYSNEDKNKADRIINYLYTKGLRTYSSQDIRPGENILKEITKGIAQSNAFIILISPESIKSDWVNQELTKALSFKKEKIYPVLIEDSNIPEIIKYIKYIDARENIQSAINEIYKLLYKNISEQMYDIHFDLKPVTNKPDRKYKKGSKYDPILDVFLDSTYNLVEITVENKNSSYLKTQFTKRIDDRNLKIKTSVINNKLFLEKI